MKSALIYLVEESKQQSITLHELQAIFQQYKQIGAKTGEQLDWNYAAYAFPYEVDRVSAEKDWFCLRSQQEGYDLIAIGIGSDDKGNFIHVTLFEQSTQGDHGKAVEICRILGKALQAEVHLYNDRIMYFYPRK